MAELEWLGRIGENIRKEYTGREGIAVVRVRNSDTPDSPSAGRVKSKCHTAVDTGTAGSERAHSEAVPISR